MIIIFVQILTVYETKYPYCLDPQTLDTLGEETLNGTLKLKVFAAHFRLDMINNVSQFCSCSLYSSYYPPVNITVSLVACMYIATSPYIGYWTKLLLCCTVITITG